MRRAWSAFVSSALLLACAPTDVVVADLPPSGDLDAGGGGGLKGPPCVDNNDCAPDDLCEKPACNALSGRCRHRPVFCDPLPDPRCGCNRVTYWNGCLRAIAGVTSDTPGECTSPAPCGGPSRVACPDAAARCARLASSLDRCGGDLVGACWVIPPSCPPPQGGVTWEACLRGPGPPPPGKPPCADTCNAIRSEVSHHRLAGPACP